MTVLRRACRGGLGREDTDLFSTHGLEHLLQLHADLLDVVEEDARLLERVNERRDVG